METENALLENLDRLHTTELGSMRIRRNLMLETEDVAAWCRDCIRSSRTGIVRKGKNWYIEAEGFVITVNAYSYTIITAHKK
mgnify:CR=1 FL=1